MLRLVEPDTVTPRKVDIGMYAVGEDILEMFAEQRKWTARSSQAVEVEFTQLSHGRIRQGRVRES